MSHTYADALQVRAEAALLAGQPLAAAQWARQARTRFAGCDNARRAALASLLVLRAEQAGDSRPDGTAVRACSLAARLRRLGLREDARTAALVAARALIGTLVSSSAPSGSRPARDRRAGSTASTPVCCGG